MASRPQKSRRPLNLPSTTKVVKASTSKGPPVPNRSKKASGNVQGDELLEAIRSLGGGDDDYELTKDLSSDETQDFSDVETNVRT